jgi:superfamily II DNA or RNA helicase
MSEHVQNEDISENIDPIAWERVALRPWQDCAVKCWLARSNRDFLLVATPGAGKTRVALAIAQLLLGQRCVERVVIVCPTEHLRRQWADAAHVLGLSLDPRFSNAEGAESDYDGIVVSYQQVMFSPSLFRKQCEDRPTFVIFDEVHHAGEHLAWGTALREAFGPAQERLSLSGTPFRNDNSPIPFISYHEGRSRADFTYSYAEALSDRVCAPIYFPTLNGRARFLSRDGSFVDCWLLDELPRTHAGERLRTVLDPRGAWMATALRAADEELTRVRSLGHQDAGALVVAIDQEHAKQIGRLLRRLTGTEPVLAISEDPGAAEKIRRYAQSKARFLVCVRMVSEGVDIPRLRVGVYATNVTSELFLRQFAGRFVRGRESATLYIPAVEPIVNAARQIKEERDHVLAQAINIPDEQIAPGNTQAATSSTIFTPLSSTSQVHDTIFDGQSFSETELAYAQRLGRELQLQLDAPVLAALLRRHAADSGVFVTHDSLPANLSSVITRKEPASGDATDFEPAATTPLSQATNPTVEAVQQLTQANAEPPLYERKEQLRRQTRSAASKLAGLIGVRPFVIHKQWIEMGGRPQSAATEADLERKLSYLLERIREAKRLRP